jgi:hypothetical protein
VSFLYFVTTTINTDFCVLKRYGDLSPPVSKQLVLQWTPAGRPPIQISYDTVSLEIVSDPIGLGSVPMTDPLSTSDANHKP